MPTTARSTRRWTVIVLAVLLGALVPLIPGTTSSPVSARTIYVVTNTSGDIKVEGSLPWALHQANFATPGFDRIWFDIPGPGPHEIKITSTLFVIDQVDIDARTQPGYNGQPLIWVTGGPTVPSLFLFQRDPWSGRTSSGSGLQGFGLTRYTSNAVTVFHTSIGNWIQHNWIGFRPTPSGVQRNTDSGLPGAHESRGVGIASSYNVVRYNTISGVYNAVVIGLDTMAGAPYHQNSVWENKIGTDPTGTTVAGYGNTSDGIFLGAGAESNWLGPNNVISGNASAGIELLHHTNWGNVVFGNTIGLDITRTKYLGNGELGVLMSGGAWYNAIGGPFGGNYIAGNRLGGISIGTTEWGASHTIWIMNNVIGLNANGQSVGHQQVGISVNNGSTKVAVAENVIGGHEQHGVIVGDPRLRTTQGNAVFANYIGRTAAGGVRTNGGHGVIFMNAGNNWATDNYFGQNDLGNVGVYSSPGLVIR